MFTPLLVADFHFCPIFMFASMSPSLARNSSLNTCPVRPNSESSAFASRKMSTYFTGSLVPMSGKAWHMGRGKTASSLPISTGVVNPTSSGFQR